MPPITSTPVDAAALAIPRPRQAGDRGVNAMQLVLFQPGHTRYRRDVTDASTPWIAYLRTAAHQAGGVAELARRIEAAESTVHRWISGRVPPESVTLGNIVAVAHAIGDDPNNALRAAGQITDAESPAPGHGPAPTLAEQIRRIRESGLPLGHQLDAVNELITLYERRAAPTPDGGDAEERSA